MKQFLFFLISFFLLISSESCKKKKPKDGRRDTADSGIIRIACDESLKDLMELEIFSFDAYNPMAVIEPVYANEDEVIRFLVEDSVRFAMVTRELNASEQRRMDERNKYLRKFLVAFEGIALITNKVNQDSLLSKSTVEKIFKGEITEWSQINPKSTLGTIRVMFDGRQTGITRFVVDSITKGGPVTPNRYAMSSIDELLEKVCEYRGAIGIVGYNQISNEIFWKNSGMNDKLRLIRVGKEDTVAVENTYLPFAEDVRKEEYPFWRPVYVLLSDPRMGLSSGFSIFIANDVGQLIILKSGLLPALKDPQNRYVIP